MPIWLLFLNWRIFRGKVTPNAPNFCNFFRLGIFGCNYEIHDFLKLKLEKHAKVFLINFGMRTLEMYILQQNKAGKTSGSNIVCRNHWKYTYVGHHSEFTFSKNERYLLMEIIRVIIMSICGLYYLLLYMEPDLGYIEVLLWPNAKELLN